MGAAAKNDRLFISPLSSRSKIGVPAATSRQHISVDSRQEPPLHLLTDNRSPLRERRQSRSALRNLGSDDSQNIGQHGASARLRDCPSHRTGGGGFRRAESGNDLSCIAAARAKRLDPVGLGRQREQPPGAILFRYQARQAAVARGRGELASHGSHARPPFAGHSMSAPRQLLSRASGIFRKDRNNYLREELDEHIEFLTADYVRSGMKESDARMAARRALGNLTRVQEDYHEQGGLPLLENTWRDLKFAVRTLRRNTVYSSSCIATL